MNWLKKLWNWLTKDTSVNAELTKDFKGVKVTKKLG